MSCEAKYPQAGQLRLQQVAIEVPFPAILVAESYGFGVQRLEDGISRLDAVGLVILANADDARQGALECVTVPGEALGAPPAQFPWPGGNHRGRRRATWGDGRQTSIYLPVGKVYATFER